MTEDVLTAIVRWLLEVGLFIIGPSLVLLAVLAWSGRWRRWAPKPDYSLGSIRYNVSPLRLAFIGLALLFFGLMAHADVGTAPGSAETYEAIAIVCCALLLISFLWWPRVLMPGWHRDWVTHVEERAGTSAAGRGRRGGRVLASDMTAVDPWPTPKEQAAGHR